MDGGVIVEEGGREVLSAPKGLHARLARMQFDGLAAQGTAAAALSVVGAARAF
jgi:hypothetical protein